MDLELHYSELENLVRSKTGTDLKFEGVSSDTIRVCYPLKVMGMTKDVGVNLQVLDVNNDNVSVQYSADGGAIVNMAISAMIGKYREQLAGKMTMDGSRITFHLSQIPGLADKLEKLQLRGVSFGGSAVSVSADLR